MEDNNAKAADTIKVASSGQSIARGAGWLVLLRFCVKLISIVSTLIIARLLVPEDFGIYALSMSIFSFVELVRAFGFGMALIQNQSATSEHYNTAWTLHFLFSLLAAIILYVFSEPISGWVKEPRLVEVVQFLSLIFILDAFNNIGIIDFQKNMQFDKEFLRLIIIKVGGFIITIPLVFLLRSYWALLYGTLATTVISVALSYLMHSFRPRFGLTYWKELLSFSIWLQLNNILKFFDRNLEKLLVSRFIGVANVGLLAMSKEIGAVPLVELVDPINRAAYPAFSKLMSDHKKLRKSFLGVFGGVALLVLPLSAGIAMLAPVFVPLLLGDSWIQVILPIQILSVANIFNALNSSVSYVFLAAARQNINFYLTILKLAIFVPLMVTMIPIFDLEGVFFSILITSIVMFPVNFYFFRRLFGLKVNEFFLQLSRPLLSMLLLVLFLRYTMMGPYSPDGTFQEILYLVMLVASGGLVFCVSLISLWLVQSKPEGAESNGLRLVEKRVSLPKWIAPRVLCDE